MNPPAPVTSTRSFMWKPCKRGPYYNLRPLVCEGRAPLILELPETHELQAREPEKRWNGDCVSPPEPPRLLGQPEQPFQPRPLHPGGRLSHAAGMEVERRPHRDQHPDVEVAADVGYPPLLLGRTEP